MSNSHLSRRDLYAHGFKEGEVWGDDERELEAALWEIDQLERQTEYEYHRPFPSHHTFRRSSAWRPSYGVSHGRYPDVQIARSDSDIISESGMSMTSLSSRSHVGYDDDSTSFDGHQRRYPHHTYPSSHFVPSAFRGYPGSQSPITSRDYHYPSPLRPSNSNYQDFRDSFAVSPHQNYGFAPSMAHSRTSSYDTIHYSHNPSQNSPAQQIDIPEQLQMVTRRSARNDSESPSPEPADNPRYASPTLAQNITPSHWSMVATEGTARSESPSVTSSYNQNFRDMGYTPRTSVDAESFEVHSPGEFYGDSDEEYTISDGDDAYYSSDSWDESSDGYH